MIRKCPVFPPDCIFMCVFQLDVPALPLPLDKEVALPTHMPPSHPHDNPPLLNHGPRRHQLRVPLWGSEELERNPHGSATDWSQPPAPSMAVWRYIGPRDCATAHTQAGSGMSRVPINAPPTVQAPREWSEKVLTVCVCECVCAELYALSPCPSFLTSPLRPAANPRMMMQCFNTHSEPLRCDAITSCTTS